MRLRKFEKRDNSLVRDWRTANAGFFPPGPELTPVTQLAWYQEYLNRPWDHQYMVMHEDARGEWPIGTLAIDIRDKTVNRVLRGEPEGSGLMSSALLELMSLYGAGAYQLQVIEGNEHAIAFYERLGFRQIGRQAQGSVMMVHMKTERM